MPSGAELVFEQTKALSKDVNGEFSGSANGSMEDTARKST